MSCVIPYESEWSKNLKKQTWYKSAKILCISGTFNFLMFSFSVRVILYISLDKKITHIFAYICIFFWIGGTVAPSVGPVSSDLPVYQEVWFIALIAILALIILFIGLACCLRRTGHKVPYIRERMPLQAKQKKMGAPLSYVIDPYTGSVMSTVST